MNGPVPGLLIRKFLYLFGPPADIRFIDFGVKQIGCEEIGQLLTRLRNAPRLIVAEVADRTGGILHANKLGHFIDNLPLIIAEARGVYRFT